MRRGIVAAVCAGVLFGGSLSASVAAASGAATSGRVEAWVMPSPTGSTSAKHPGKIILTGAVGDYGVALKVNAAGKATSKGAYRLAKLKKGTILIDIAKFQVAQDKAFSSVKINAANCSAFVSASSPVTIVSGTGAYKGITGSLTITALFGGITPRAEDGSCTTKTTTPALATYVTITGSGTVTLP